MCRTFPTPRRSGFTLGIWSLAKGGGHYAVNRKWGFTYAGIFQTVNTNIAEAHPEHKQTLLIVDDEPASMRALCDTLGYEGYKTYGFTTPTEALAAMRERHFDLLLAEIGRASCRERV